MARDYRHGPARRAGFKRQSQQGQESEQPSVSSNQWIIWGGVLLTVGLMGAFVIIKHFAAQSQQTSGVSEVYQAVNAPAVEEEPVREVVELVVPDTTSQPEEVEAVEEESTRFTFYADLPQMEVVVDAEPLPVTLPDPMWIQAGSFRRLEQAQTEQARVARGGHELEIAPIETRNGTFYRLMIGPFTDRLELNRVRNQIRRFGADTRVLRIPVSEEAPSEP